MEHHDEFRELAHMVLAPWIARATALRGCERRVGGNQFRHAMSTLGILIDYHYISPVLLKASVIHDLKEDIPSTYIEELEQIDEDAAAVIKLMMEVTRLPEESKPEFLQRIATEGSHEARVLKCADRISNLTDLHAHFFTKEKIMSYLAETREFIYPMAIETDKNMAFEINDLITRREALLEKL